LNCQRLMLIYPQSAKMAPVRQIYQISNLGAQIFINTVNLHVPLRKKEPFIAELHEIFSQAFEEKKGPYIETIIQ
jgi:hypothetical protein